MNNVVMGGRVCTIPKIRVLQLGTTSVSICTFTIAVVDAKFSFQKENEYQGENVDYFECITFNEAASIVNRNFVKGSKIICSGKLKNHHFEDANQTKHFTQVFVVSNVEFGDTEAVFKKYSDKKSVELSIVSDLREIDILYKKVCDYGYLCIDEDDYYKIAMSNI